MDIKRVSSTKGTCKDMCPEKERMMRVVTLQVASFEYSDQGQQMDPKKAVKQYSRSSADQEIPLSHELRSEETLKTTMTYLLWNIIDLCDDEDVSTGDWYHFVWDRTRGIRKEITQQELCSETSVELLEQCARFHIHCSGRLIAEEPGVFDPKINDENLIKSLQTLKYMYDDLKLKNVKCPNEAEFRAYVVLLNLNESGNFLWEIKRLEKDILNSKEVRFALDLYFAVALNNYVKFFNLVREASYMNACLLLKYFTQIRVKAIFTILRSYTVRRAATVTLNLSYLTEILAFEDCEATEFFMTYHGAVCDPDSDTVNLEYATFGNPDASFPMQRAYQIVETKLEGVVSEAICGTKLPSPECFLKLQPHSSFDADGYLKKTAFYVEDQNGPAPIRDGIFKVPKESPPISPAKSMFQQRNTFKPDQPDGTANNNENNVFGKRKSNENPFLRAPKPVSSVFSNSPKAFGTFEATTSSSSIFGAAKNSDSIFGSQEVKPINPYIFAKPINQESPKSVASSSSSSPATSSMFSPQSQTSQQSSQNSNFSFGMLMQRNTLNSLSPASASSIFSSPSSLQDQQRETDQNKLAEQERLRKENQAVEDKLRQKLQDKIRQENERREAERIRLEEEEQVKREMEELKEKQVHEDAVNILESLIDEIVKAKVTNDMKSAYKMFVELPKDFYDALEYDVVVEQLIKIYQQELLSYINMTKRKTEAMQKFFIHWRTTTARELNRRELLSNIGCPNLNKSLDERALDVSHPEQRLTLANMKQYLSGSPQQIVIPDLDNYKIIDLFRQLKFVHENLPHKLFWKMLISVPMKNVERSMSFACFIKKWLNKTFNIADCESEIFFMKRQNVQSIQRMVSICIRKVQGVDCLNEKGDAGPDNLNDANSLLFYCTTSNLSASRRRLQKILSSLDNPICVSIIIYKNVIEVTDEHMIEQHMDLTSEPKVKSFEISIFYEYQNKSKDLTQVTLESCQFLCDNYLQQLTGEHEQIFDLEMQHLLDFFQMFFGDEMWQRIELSCKNGKEFNKRMSSFNNVVHVFNACIEKVYEALSADYSCLPSLPNEFRALLPSMEVRIPHSFEFFPPNWKTNQQQKKLTAFLRDLKLTKMSNDRFKNFNDFKENLSAFLEINMPTFKSQVFNAIIEKIVHNFYQMQVNGVENVDNAILRMRWLQILGCIVIGKFNEHYQHQRKELPESIIYFKSQMKKYLIPWWYSIHFDLTNGSQEEPINKKAKISQKIDSKELESVLKKGMDSLKKVDGLISKSRENVNKTRDDSKTTDQYFYKCEEKFRGMKRSLKSIHDK